MKQISFIFTLLLMIAITQQSVYSGEYTLINKTGSGVTGIFISVAGANTWIAVGSSMSSNQMITLTFDASSQNCQYNIKFSDNTGKEHILESVDMCSSSEIILSINNSTETGKIKLPVKGSK